MERLKHIFGFKRWVGAVVALALALWPLGAFAATLLPNGKQQFIDGNGNPLAGGSVYFYIPGTSTLKNTYQNSASTILNTNPVVLDGNGYAVIYGTGSYRQVVKDSSGNTIWDQLTADTSSAQNSWAGDSSGTANALTLTATNFSSQAGQSITFRATTTNTGATTLNVNGIGALAVVKDYGGGLGPLPLVGGEISAGAFVTVFYDSTLGNFHLGNVPIPQNSATSVAAGTTINLGALQSQAAQVTGSGASITSFGTLTMTYSPVMVLSFSGANTIVYNATSMITPTGANLAISAGDSIVAVYLGGGNWRIASQYSTIVPAVAQAQALGVTVTNNAGTPDTKSDITFVSAMLVSGVQSVKVGGTTLTIDYSTVGANGLDAGAIAANTWYYEYIIYNSTTATTAGLASTSASAPTLPSGYGYPLRVGAMRTDSAKKLYRTIQRGRTTQYINPASATLSTGVPLLVSGTAGNVSTPTYVAQSLAGFVPSTATTVQGFGFGYSSHILLAPNGNYGGYTSSTNPPPYGPGIGSNASQFQFSMLLETQNLYYASDGSASTAAVFISGWTDSASVN